VPVLNYALRSDELRGRGVIRQNYICDDNCGFVWVWNSVANVKGIK
jgi:hypothetical protein